MFVCCLTCVIVLIREPHQFINSVPRIVWHILMSVPRHVINAHTFLAVTTVWYTLLDSECVFSTIVAVPEFLKLLFKYILFFEKSTKNSLIWMIVCEIIHSWVFFCSDRRTTINIDTYFYVWRFYLHEKKICLNIFYGGIQTIFVRWQCVMKI